MDKDNPAVYECPKGKDNMHNWVRFGVGKACAICVKCRLQLTAEQTRQVFEGVG